MDDTWESNVSPLMMGVGMGDMRGMGDIQQPSCSGQDLSGDINHQHQDLQAHPADISQDMSSDMQDLDRDLGHNMHHHQTSLNHNYYNSQQVRRYT